MQKRFTRLVVEENDQIGLPSPIEASLALGRAAARGRWDGDDAFGIDARLARGGRFCLGDGRGRGGFRFRILQLGDDAALLVQCHIAPGGGLHNFTGFEWCWTFGLAAPGDETRLPSSPMREADPLGSLDLHVGGFIFTSLAACQEIDIGTIGPPPPPPILA
jgi:hypothetical protein